MRVRTCAYQWAADPGSQLNDPSHIGLEQWVTVSARIVKSTSRVFPVGTTVYLGFGDSEGHTEIRMTANSTGTLAFYPKPQQVHVSAHSA